MRIQADTLSGTGDPQLVQAGLELVEQACAEFPDATDRSWMLEIAGKCCQALGRVDDAIEYYRRALQRDRESPGFNSNAGYRLATLVVEAERHELYDEAIVVVQARGKATFPTQAYTIDGVRAIVSHRRGDTDSAKAFAQAALAAAGVRDIGLSHGRGQLGTVQNTSTAFHRKLLAILETEEPA